MTPNRKANHKLRKAMERGSLGEMVVPEEIFERDGWLCGFCSLPVDPDLQYPDPKSASLDHILPIRLGGTHTEDNLRCAHLDCNTGEGWKIRDLVRAA